MKAVFRSPPDKLRSLWRIGTLVLALGAWAGLAACSKFLDNDTQSRGSAIASKTHLVLFGSRDESEDSGIFAARMDQETGALEALGVVGNAGRSTWLTAHPTAPVVFATSGPSDGSNGAIVSFKINPESGKLTKIGHADSGGRDPTHVGFDAASRTLFVANFRNGRIAVLPLDENKAPLAPVIVVQQEGDGPHRRQNSSHPHAAVLDPAGRYLLAPDMGADRIFIYSFDPGNRRLAPAKQPYVAVTPGSGPRHLAFHPNGGHVYVIFELTAEIGVFRWDGENGALQQIDTIALTRPDHTGRISASEIAVTEDGRFLYASDRGSHEIVAFELSPSGGEPREIQRISTGGELPWHFALSPSGRWLVIANNKSHSVSLLARDADSGRLTSSEHWLEVPSVSNVTFATESTFSPVD